VALVLAIVILPGTLLRVELSFCIAVAVSCAVMGVALTARLRRAEAASLTSPAG
jgi:thermostable 8-oxoguanine DNA glycosylase